MMMMRKFYIANLMRENRDGKLELTGSKIVGIWFWESPIAAYKKLGGTKEFPVDVRRIK